MSGRAVVLYRRGPRWEEVKPLGEQAVVHDHLAYLTGLYRDGLIELAGPFHSLADLVEHELVGLVVHRGDAAAAAERARRDPAVEAGLLEFDALDWHA